MNIKALREYDFLQGLYVRSRVQICLRTLGGVLFVYSTWTFQGTEHTTVLGLLFRAIAGSGSFYPHEQPSPLPEGVLLEW